MLSRIPATYQRALVFGLPALSLLIALLLVVPRYRALAADRNTLTETRQVVRAKRSFIADAAREGRGPVVAQLPADRNEPVRFLRELTALATRCGVKFTNVAPTVAEESREALSPTGGTEENAANAAHTKLPPGTTPIALQISVDGSYPALALFFSRLETFPRLISVTNVSMNATQYPKISAQFRLTRYTDAAPGAPGGTDAQ